LAIWVLLINPRLRDPRARAETSARWTGYWARYCCRAAGFRVDCRGELPRNGSLIVPNHLGYADVLAVGSCVACFFVAKLDVERWPFIGTLFRVSHNIGVPRTRAKALIETTRQIEDRLRNGASVCVFLEGTSSGGTRLLPFYAPLVQPAIDADAPVVPVAIRWTADDAKIDIAEDVAYWRPEHTFGPHAWRLLGLRGVRAEIEFGRPIYPSGHHRKSLADAANRAVADLLGIEPSAPL
jgi:1-acyl-sn-glycerol-3-phosphate acyltransferase